MKVYKVSNSQTGGYIIDDNLDSVLQTARELLEAGSGIFTIRISIDEMSKTQYLALPEFEGW